MSTENGNVRWATQLDGAVKAAPAFHKGVLFVGDYGGEMSAIHAATGKIKWQASSQGLSFQRTGEFYSTPAVAFGRVYGGNNDGRVYSFSEKTGTLAWTHSTGSYVYSGATVPNSPHTAPTIYIGSIDGNVYALDAKTGDTRWTRPVGQVIGSLSAVGNIVYVSTFEGTTTYGFGLKYGREVFKYDTGAYTPVVSDGRRIYLTGYSSITALQPIHHKPGQGKKNGKNAHGKKPGKKGGKAGQHAKKQKKQEKQTHKGQGKKSGAQRQQQQQKPKQPQQKRKGGRSNGRAGT
jgi:outer membrane protein assembly factor BamB